MRKVHQVLLFVLILSFSVAENVLLLLVLISGALVFISNYF